MNLKHRNTECPEDWMGPFILSSEPGTIITDAFYEWDEYNRIFYADYDGGYHAIRLADVYSWTPAQEVANRIFNELDV